MLTNNTFSQTDIDQIPPDNAKKIYPVIEYLEKQGIKELLSIRFDEWIWKASALEGNKKNIF